MGVKSKPTPTIRVLNPYGAPLADLKQSSAARRLIETNQARIVARNPFTIQLAVHRDYFPTTRDFVL